MYSNTVLYCDVIGCKKSTTYTYPGAHSGKWTFVNGYDICEKCKKESEEKFGDNWLSGLHLKDYGREEV